tara:strand:+ start:2544 stop:4352 length:1809 start_codon:yes stop_codon:yes gene_type:complete
MTSSVSKQILKNKLKEKSQAESEFSTETKELIQQRASVEGSTISKVGQTSSGFTSITGSVGNKPVFDGAVAAIMNEPVDGLLKEPSDASKLSAITGTTNTGANLTEVVTQANVKGMDVALREKAGVSNTAVADIVTDASPIKDKVKTSVPLVQTGGIEEEAGKKAVNASKKISTELGNGFGFNNLFGSISSGVGNILPQLLTQTFGSASIKQIEKATNFVKEGLQLVNQRGVKVTPPPVTNAGGTSNLSDIFTKSTQGNPDWKTNLEYDVYKVGQNDSKWQGANTIGTAIGGSYEFKTLSTYDHIEAEFRNANNLREITSLIIDWTGLENGYDQYSVDRIHQLVIKRHNENYTPATVNASPLRFGLQTNIYLHQSGLVKKVVPISKGTTALRFPERQSIIEKSIVVMLNCSTDVTTSTRQRESLDEIIKAFMKVFPGGEILGMRDLPPVGKTQAPGFDVRDYVLRKFGKNTTYSAETIDTIPTGTELADRKPNNVTPVQPEHNKIPDINDVVTEATKTPVNFDEVAKTYEDDNQFIVDQLRQKGQLHQQNLEETGSGISGTLTERIDADLEKQLSTNLNNKIEALKDGQVYDPLSNKFVRQI